MNILLAYIALLAFQLLWLEYGPSSMRWAEGWLVPHREPQDQCLFKCGVCRRDMVG